MQETLDPMTLSFEELFKTDEGMTIAVTKHIPVEEYETLWNIVDVGFQELNKKSHEKQDMTREELEYDLQSESVLKYVARDEDKGLVGLLTVHIGLEDITWIDASELEKVQLQTDPEAIPYYVGTIVVPVSERGTSAASNLIQGALTHFKQVNESTGHDSLVFFDCAEANYPWLGQFIQEVGSPSEQFPQLNTQVKELYSDSWLVDSEGAITKARSVADIIGTNVVDKQHYYAISINRE